MTSEATAIAPACPERWEFPIGADVFFADGTPGKVWRVVVDPVEQQVQSLIVRRDTLPPQNLVVPVEAVERANDEAVDLSWNIQEAAARGRYNERAFHSLGRQMKGYGLGEALLSVFGGKRGEPKEDGTTPGTLPPIRMGLRVVALDGPAGTVREVLVDSASRRVTHFVVRLGKLVKADHLVPVEWVQSVTAEVVTVAVSIADLERLPPYRPDEALQAEILDRWWGDGTLHAMMVLTYLQARVRDGVATLEGYAWSQMHKRRLEELAARVPGVQEVRNEIVADDELSIRVMEAITEDPRIHAVHVEVDSYLGNIRLEGDAPDPVVREAMAEAAASVPRVKSVLNHLRIQGREIEPVPEEVRKLLPRVGQLVLTPNGDFGTVARVILEPRTTLVIAFVAEGELPVLPEFEQYARPVDFPRRQRKVVIPEEWIEAVTHDRVLLAVGTREASVAPEFIPEQYLSLSPTCLPPFPYEADEVLLDLKQSP